MSSELADCVGQAAPPMPTWTELSKLLPRRASATRAASDVLARAPERQLTNTKLRERFSALAPDDLGDPGQRTLGSILAARRAHSSSRTAMCGSSAAPGRTRQ